jgi:hypothetical protein
VQHHSAESEDLDGLPARYPCVGREPPRMGNQSTIVHQPDVMILRSPFDSQVFCPEGIVLTVDDLGILLRAEVREVDQFHTGECNRPSPLNVGSGSRRGSPPPADRSWQLLDDPDHLIRTATLAFGVPQARVIAYDFWSNQAGSPEGVCLGDVIKVSRRARVSSMSRRVLPDQMSPSFNNAR